MSQPVVGVLAYPLGEDFGVAELPRRTTRRAYRRALLEKANPRSPAYMRELFADRYPDGRIETDVSAVDGAHTIVLLYPDAIGLGWEPIERRLPPDVRVLNGRGREFALDRRARIALRARRLLERTMLVEAVALVAAAAATPALLAADLLRGRR